MTVKKIGPGVFSVGAQDWDRRLFDELIPLPEGTSYNSFLIKGTEKTALIDGVDPTKEHELVANLRELGVETIDYVVSNHSEQDHSGAIPTILEIYPDAKVVTNAKGVSMLKELHAIAADRFIQINDRDSLSLGEKTLEFIFAPWVHWPETIFTYLREDKILFTCDLFGSHLATSDLYATDKAQVGISAKRYYAEIMMPFRKRISLHLKKVAELEVDIIAPSHGPLYDDPSLITDAYADWVSDDVKNEAVIAYVSMHGSTRLMVDFLVDALIKRGVTVKPFNLTRTDTGALAISLVDAAMLVLASPTVLTEPHPTVTHAAILVNSLKPKLQFAAIIGSFGWGGRTVEILNETMSSIKPEYFPPLLVKGRPTEEDFVALDRLADEIAAKLKNM